jgi:chromosome segregation ATPase
MSSDSISFDLDSSLRLIGEVTTAKDLARRQDITGSLRVVSRKSLTKLIESLVNQAISSREDAFTDQEKDLLLKAAQAELAVRAAREQRAFLEQVAVQAELDDALHNLKRFNKVDQEFEQALNSVKLKLRDTEQRTEGLRAQNAELQDEVKEKLTLLTSTVAEKEKLRESIRVQVIHSSSIIQKILELDRVFYGGSHAQQINLRENAADAEVLFQEFSVGAKVLEDLQGHLQVLRKEIWTDHSCPAASLDADVLLVQRMRGEAHGAGSFKKSIGSLTSHIRRIQVQADDFHGIINDSMGRARDLFRDLPKLPGSQVEPVEGLAAIERFCDLLGKRLTQDAVDLKALVQKIGEAERAQHAGEGQIEVVRSQMLAAEVLAEGKEHQVNELTGQLSAKSMELVQVRRELAMHIDLAQTELVTVQGMLDQAQANLAETQGKLEAAESSAVNLQDEVTRLLSVEKIHEARIALLSAQAEKDDPPPVWLTS